jgi:hypothetical protein
MRVSAGARSPVQRQRRASESAVGGAESWASRLAGTSLSDDGAGAGAADGGAGGDAADGDAAEEPAACGLVRFVDFERGSEERFGARALPDADGAGTGALAEVAGWLAPRTVPAEGADGGAAVAGGGSGEGAVAGAETATLAVTGGAATAADSAARRFSERRTPYAVARPTSIAAPKSAMRFQTLSLVRSPTSAISGMYGRCAAGMGGAYAAYAAYGSCDAA